MIRLVKFVEISRNYFRGPSNSAKFFMRSFVYSPFTFRLLFVYSPFGSYGDTAFRRCSTKQKRDLLKISRSRRWIVRLNLWFRHVQSIEVNRSRLMIGG